MVRVPANQSRSCGFESHRLLQSFSFLLLLLVFPLQLSLIGVSSILNQVTQGDATLVKM